MEIIGKLKEDVEKAENKEEAKKIIKNASAEAGIILSEEELDQVAGGKTRDVRHYFSKPILPIQKAMFSSGAVFRALNQEIPYRLGKLAGFFYAMKPTIHHALHSSPLPQLHIRHLKPALTERLTGVFIV